MPGLQSVSKKRPAVSQGGPKSKKRHSEKPSAKFEEEKLQKRSRPVTQPMQESMLSDDGDDGDEDNFDEEPGDQEIDAGDMIVDDAPSKDPNSMSGHRKRMHLTHNFV